MLPSTLTLLSVLATALPVVSSLFQDDAPTFVRAEGRCAMRDSCGRKSVFSGEIPCPDNGPATAHDDDLTYGALLARICGEDFPTTTCCTTGQLETLQANLAQADPLISACPACRLNFRRFFCSFTCSPDQSLFLTLTSTQTLKKDGKQREAVKSVEFAVAEEFGEGFFDACKDVKFGATNGFAMDLIGGGAKDWLSFLRYMGQERALGSPFQIDIPSPNSPPSQNTTVTPPTPFSAPSESCSSTSLATRCACPDCPAICASLPPLLSPHEKWERRCRVGRMDCFPFALVLVYAVAVLVVVFGGVGREVTRRMGSKGGAIRLGDEESDAGAGETESLLTRLVRRLDYSNLFMPSSTGRPRRSSLIGSDTEYSTSPLPLDSAPRSDDLLSEAEYDPSPAPLASSSPPLSRSTPHTGDDSFTPSSSTRTRGGTVDSGSSRSLRRTDDSSHSQSQRLSSRGASLLDPAADSSALLQPRSYPLNTLLSRAFHRLGLFCSTHPFLVLAIGLAVCGLANAGWARLEIEKDPVELWVPKDSEVRREKETFEKAFGPFYRTEQIFFSVAPPVTLNMMDGREGEEKQEWNPIDQPVLSWPVLQYILDIETQIRSLASPTSNVTLKDVCFAPTTMAEDGRTALSIDDCVVQSPLGYFQNSLEGVTEDSWPSQLDACTSIPASCLTPFGQPLNPKLVFGGVPNGAGTHDARAVIITYVVRNSVDPVEVARAEAWETALRDYLRQLADPEGEARRDYNLKVSWSVGTSLEEELNAATNTDVPIVIASYLLMFAYVAVSLGGSATGLVKVFGRIAVLLSAGLLRLVKWMAQKVQALSGRGGVKLDEDEAEEQTGRPGRFRTASGAIPDGFGAPTRPRKDSLMAYFKKQVLVDSKFLLGLWGILIVLLSVSTSVALCSTAGVRTTLIIAEVIPFLVLAIGVDNVFLLSHELDQQKRENSLLLPGEEYEDEVVTEPSLPAEERVARALGRMGPSILLSASCQTLAFGLGALVGMPAVRNFAIYAAVAVLLNALLQITVFVAAMAVDLRRVESNRIDCFPCIKVSSISATEHSAHPTESLLAYFVRTFYTPTLLRRPVKYLVLLLFSGLFVLSWIGARHINLGLDQRLALPRSSNLVDYFNAVDEYLDVGPPVYFVVEDLNVAALPNVRHLCGRFSTCDQFSLANSLEAERKRPEVSYLAEPPAVWVDDFVQWLNPLLEDCCRVKRRALDEFCGPNDSDSLCKPCFEDREPPWNTTLEGLPEDGEFMRFVKHWLDSPTDEACPLGGKAAYSSALAISEDGENINVSQFRTYHTPLKTQDDFINAVAAAHRIAADLTKQTGARVFPYSLFYVFFSSYDTIRSTSRLVLFIALSAVFAVTAALLGSIRTASVVICTVFLSLISVLGVMGVWSVSLNPLSLVNLVIAIGIAVEFCAHIARAFVGALDGGLPRSHPQAQRDRDERARTALEDVGASVMSGIGATKLIGISVLWLTRSALLKTYYARIWLALIVSSAVHGFVFLPVALSFWGGQGYALTAEEGDGPWTVEGLYRDRPFVDDDASSGDSEY
ncbi:vacuolar membrane protein [Rhodotorula toruloides]|uniref:Vacuolar membrane protein n=1 Tax=Rhodotorula toruloides TaxID=5286 RepID=A0A511K879_RHOTO|nr:vacuolar membrane protein [Rhodotorula toruloides]